MLRWYCPLLLPTGEGDVEETEEDAGSTILPLEEISILAGLLLSSCTGEDVLVLILLNLLVL